MKKQLQNLVKKNKEALEGKDHQNFLKIIEYIQKKNRKSEKKKLKNVLAAHDEREYLERN